MKMLFLFSKCLLWLFMCFIYVFRLNWCIERTLESMEWNVKLVKPKEAISILCWVITYGTSRDREILCWVIIACRVVTVADCADLWHCAESFQGSYNFLALCSFHISVIIEGLVNMEDNENAEFKIFHCMQLLPKRKEPWPSPPFPQMFWATSSWKGGYHA